MTGETTLLAPAFNNRFTADSSFARETIIKSLLMSRAVRVMYKLSGSEETAHKSPHARSMPAAFSTSSLVASPHQDEEAFRQQLVGNVLVAFDDYELFAAPLHLEYDARADAACSANDVVVAKLIISLNILRSEGCGEGRDSTTDWAATDMA